MKHFLCAALMLTCGIATQAAARGDDAGVKVILEKAIKALGGEAKLAKAGSFSEKAKGTITLGGNDNPIATERTVQGLERQRYEFEGEFGGNKVLGVTVLNGDKAWRKFADNKMELDVNAVANEKRTVYLHVIPATIVALKGTTFKVETAGDETVGDKPASVLKVTAPDGKDFTLAFDKASGLPVRMVAKVLGFQGQEYTQETTYSEPKEFDGIKRACKIESKRNGEPFLKQEIFEFKVLDKADQNAFTEPQ